jgi:hypothetical protein
MVRRRAISIQEAEPQFAAELERLLRAVGANVDIIANTGSGAVATHGGVAAGEGGVAVGGDVHRDINVNAPRKKG